MVDKFIDMDSDENGNSEDGDDFQLPDYQNSQEYISKQDFEKYRSEVRQELDDLVQRMNQIMFDLKKEIIGLPNYSPPDQGNK